MYQLGLVSKLIVTCLLQMRNMSEGHHSYFSLLCQQICFELRRRCKLNFIEALTLFLRGQFWGNYNRGNQLVVRGAEYNFFKI